MGAKNSRHQHKQDVPRKRQKLLELRRRARAQDLRGGADLDIDECAICLEPLSHTPTYPVPFQECQHHQVLHASCVQELLASGDNRCPLCRKPILREATFQQEQQRREEERVARVRDEFVQQFLEPIRTQWSENDIDREVFAQYEPRIVSRLRSLFHQMSTLQRESDEQFDALEAAAEEIEDVSDELEEIKDRLNQAVTDAMDAAFGEIDEWQDEAKEQFYSAFDEASEDMPPSPYLQSPPRSRFLQMTPARRALREFIASQPDRPVRRRTSPVRYRPY